MTQPNFVWKKINDSAGNARPSGSLIKIGFPKTNTTLYPGQTYRVNTGWSIQALPSNSILTMSTHPYLQSVGLLSLPKSIHSQNVNVSPTILKGTQQQLTQVIQNNSPYPIKIQTLTQPLTGQQKPHMFICNPQLLKQQKLQFDLGNFLEGVVGVAAHVITHML